MNFKIYKQEPLKCHMCDNEGVLLPICVIDGKEKMIPVCRECRDNLPYEVIPVRAVLGEGYICYNKSKPKS